MNYIAILIQPAYIQCHFSNSPRGLLERTMGPLTRKETRIFKEIVLPLDYSVGCRRVVIRATTPQDLGYVADWNHGYSDTRFPRWLAPMVIAKPNGARISD